MSFNEGLVKAALNAAFSTKNVGDILKFPDADPVFSNGADVASAPSIANVSGVPIASYELRSRYLYMKYAFTVETLAMAGIADDTIFQARFKHYFQSEYQNYILSVIPAGSVYNTPSSSEIVFEFNNIVAGGTPTKVARAYTNIRYWFKLP